MNWKTIEFHFPVNREYIWLNNCGVTPAGEHVVSEVCQYLALFSKNGYMIKNAGYKQIKQQIKELVAPVINCHPDELAVIHNTAEGMNFVSHGMDLKEGDRILLLDNEYPSNIYPWQHLKQKGVIIDMIPIEPTPAKFFDTLKKMISKNTKLVSVSAVHWCTGMPLPLESMGAYLKERNIEFVVDGAQGVGMVPIDVKKANISFMAFSAWKWLMGPVGVGIFYVAKDKLRRLNPVFIGTESVIDDEQYLPYKTELKPTADRFTISTGNVNDWIYFKAALEFLTQIGWQKVHRRIYELSEYLAVGLKHNGFQIVHDDFSENPTGIVVCDKPELSSKQAVSYLASNKIIAADRLNRIRFSPHIYNTFAQMDRTVELLARFTR